MTKKLLYILLAFQFLMVSKAFASGNYCAAIRGNGELIPAHWGAMAKLVEQQGVPTAMAGGSSASVTQFLLESIFSNNSVKNENNLELKNRKAALLIKSIYPYFIAMAKQDGLVDIFGLLGNKESKEKTSFINQIKKLSNLSVVDKNVIKKVLGKYHLLFNQEFLNSIQAHPEVFIPELNNKIKTFTSFNVDSDKRIFFEHGLIDFAQLALIFGEIADFYAGYTSEKVKQGQTDFLNACSQQTFGKLWSEVSIDCKDKFNLLVRGHLAFKKLNPKSAQRIFEKVGQHMTAYPTTAIIKGESYRRYLEYQKDYFSTKKSTFADFTIDYKDFKFGYWGRSVNELNKINRNLKSFFPKDEKSKQFSSLGTATWYQVLAVSPAEPGLVNFRPIPQVDSLGKITTRTGMVSAGGWSDLHPTLVLRASGCKKIVYVTRKGGDSVFAQKMLVSLLGEELIVDFWQDLSEYNDYGYLAKGTRLEQTKWNKLFNAHNLQSSFKRSLAEADQVLCTDWDRFDNIYKQAQEVIENGYRSRIYNLENLNPKIPGCTF